MVTDAPARTAGRGARARALASALTVVLRVVAVLLLATSAVLGWQAAWSRWSVCFVGGQPPVDGLPEDGAGGCVALQDHLYDYSFPSEPWVPIADAAQREGVSLLALGIAAVLVSLTVGGRWFIWVLAMAAGAAVGTMWMVAGVSSLLSGRAGEPVTVDPQILRASVIWLGPWITACLAGLAWQRANASSSMRQWKPGTAADGRLLAVFWVAMTAAQPLPEFFITLMFWNSHDSSPLEGFFRCTAVTVAAVAVAATLIPPSRRSRFVPRPLRRVGRMVRRALARVADNLRRGDTWQDPRAER
jgi:hypothetical protein